MNYVSSRKKADPGHILFVVFLSLWGLVILYPFYNSVLVSIVPLHVYIKTPFLIYPVKIDLNSYYLVLRWKMMLNGAGITTLITVFGTAYNLLLTITLAYGLSKRIPGRKFINYMIIFTMYFSGGLIPFFLLVRNLGLIASIFSMILPTGINIIYFLIMRSYFYTIPAEIEESAKLDGAGEFRTLFRIVLPLCLPMLATIGLYYAVDRWNEWWLGMLFAQKVELWPLQLFIRNMLQDSSFVANQHTPSIPVPVFPAGIRMATIVITTIPIVCVYPFLQKFFVKGLVLGGVKG